MSMQDFIQKLVDAVSEIDFNSPRVLENKRRFPCAVDMARALAAGVTSGVPEYPSHTMSYLPLKQTDGAVVPIGEAAAKRLRERGIELESDFQRMINLRLGNLKLQTIYEAIADSLKDGDSAEVETPYGLNETDLNRKKYTCVLHVAAGFGEKDFPVEELWTISGPAFADADPRPACPYCRHKLYQDHEVKTYPFAAFLNTQRQKLAHQEFEQKIGGKLDMEDFLGEFDLSKESETNGNGNGKSEAKASGKSKKSTAKPKPKTKAKKSKKDESADEPAEVSA